jgi:hypothetical protein
MATPNHQNRTQRHIHLHPNFPLLEYTHLYVAVLYTLHLRREIVLSQDLERRSVVTLKFLCEAVLTDRPTFVA